MPEQKRNHFYENRIALVTGAASGIGRALSIQLLQQATKVIAVDVNQQGLISLEHETQKYNKRCIPVYLNLCEIEVIPSLIETIAQENPIDLLINNGGISFSIPMGKLDINSVRLYDNKYSCINCVYK
ncbi:MAG: SDR family NAD(P)-dependent oxidoreductase [Parafilimonas sp.]